MSSRIERDLTDPQAGTRTILVRVVPGAMLIPQGEHARRSDRDPYCRLERSVELFVDDNRLESPDLTDETLEHVVRQVQADRCARGRIIVSLRCDGLEMTGNEMVARLREPASSVQRLEVFTGSPSGLVAEAMVQSAVALTDTEGERRRAADLLTEGNISDGVALLGDVLRVYQQIHDAVSKSLQMLELDAREVMIDGRSLQECFEAPTELLQQIKQALMAQDHVLLADILQYEFEDVVTQWQAAVADLRQRALALAEESADLT